MKTIAFLVLFFIAFSSMTYSQTLEVFYDNQTNRFGLKTKSGNIIVPAKNNKIEVCPTTDTYLIYVKEGKIIIVDNKGEKIYGPFVKFNGDFTKGRIAAYYGPSTKDYQALVTSSGIEYFKTRDKEEGYNFLSIIPGTDLGLDKNGIVGLDGKYVLSGSFYKTELSGTQKFFWTWDRAIEICYGINLDGSVLFKGSYTRIWEPEYLSKQGFFFVYSGDTCGLLSNSGKIIVPCKFSLVSTESKTFKTRTFKDHLEGLYSLTGEELIPAIYVQLNMQSDGMFICYTVDKSCGIVSKDGILIVPAIYDLINFRRDNLFYVRKNGKWGLMERDGSLLFNCEYDGFSHITPEVLDIEQSKKHGIYNIKSRHKSDIIYKNIEHISLTDKFIATTSESLSGILTSEGNWVVKPLFDKISFVGNLGVAKVNTTGKFGIIDTTGKWILQPNFEDIHSVGLDRYAIAKLNGKYGIIDLDGKWSVQPNYDSMHYIYRNYRIEVKLNGKVGLIDNNGKLILPAKFDELPVFELNGKAKAKVDGSIGVIDSAGNYILPPLYDDVAFIKQNYLVKKGLGWHIITDPANFLVLYPDFNEYYRVSLNEYQIKKGDKWGLMSGDGAIIYEPIYDKPFSFGTQSYATIYLNNVAYTVMEKKMNGLKDGNSFVFFWSADDRIVSAHPLQIIIYSAKDMSVVSNFKIYNKSASMPDCSLNYTAKRLLPFGNYKYKAIFESAETPLSDFKVSNEARCFLIQIQ